MKLKFNQKYEVYREGTTVPGIHLEFGGEFLGTIEIEERVFNTPRGMYGGWTRLTPEELHGIASKIEELTKDKTEVKTNGKSE